MPTKSANDLEPQENLITPTPLEPDTLPIESGNYFAEVLSIVNRVTSRRKSYKHIAFKVFLKRGGTRTVFGTLFHEPTFVVGDLVKIYVAIETFETMTFNRVNKVESPYV